MPETDSPTLPLTSQGNQHLAVSHFNATAPEHLVITGLRYATPTPPAGRNRYNPGDVLFTGRPLSSAEGTEITVRAESAWVTLLRLGGLGRDESFALVGPYQRTNLDLDHDQETYLNAFGLSSSLINCFFASAHVSTFPILTFLSTAVTGYLEHDDAEMAQSAARAKFAEGSRTFRHAIADNNTHLLALSERDAIIDLFSDIHESVNLVRLMATRPEHQHEVLAMLYRPSKEQVAALLDNSHIAEADLAGLVALGYVTTKIVNQLRDDGTITPLEPGNPEENSEAE